MIQYASTIEDTDWWGNVDRHFTTADAWICDMADTAWALSQLWNGLRHSIPSFTTGFAASNIPVTFFCIHKQDSFFFHGSQVKDQKSFCAIIARLQIRISTNSWPEAKVENCLCFLAGKDGILSLPC